MAEFPRRADYRRLMGFGYPQRVAKELASQYNSDMERADEIRRVLAASPSDQAKLMTSDSADPALQALRSAQEQPAPTIQARYARDHHGNVTALSREDDRAGIGRFAEPAMRSKIDPDRAALDRAARQLSKDHKLPYVDAACAIESAREGLELAKVDGSAEVPWNDTRPLAPGEVDPDNGQHLQRDRRRAEAGGVNFSEEAWRAHAVLGRDFVGESAEQMRQQALADKQAQTRTIIAEGQRRQAIEDVKARNAEAHERHRTQLRQARAAREEQTHGRDDHDGDFVPW